MDNINGFLEQMALVESPDPIGRREFFECLARLTAITAAACAATLSGQPEANAERGLDVLRADLLSPINLPRIGINSRSLNLSELPPHIQRIALFYTGMGCKPCEKLEQIMKEQWGAKPSDTLIVPVVDDDCQSDDKLWHTGDPSLDSKVKAFLEQYGKEEDPAVKERCLQWLKGKYEFFVSRGAPGIYAEAGDESLRNTSGIPSVVVVRRNDGRVIRRTKGFDSREAGNSNIWAEILAR